MNNCKHLKIEDKTPWHGDIFDHPRYKYTCQNKNKSVIPYIHCNSERCKNYLKSED